MNRRSIYFKLAMMLVCTTFFSACSTNSPTKTTTQTEVASKVSVSSIVADKSIQNIIGELVTYDKEDYYSDWKTENPNYIELNGNTATLKGSGAAVKDSIVTITSAGLYVISGNLNDGQIILDVKDKGTVRLVLNGADIKSSSNSPIYVKNAGKTIISLQEGTENTITDGKKYILADTSIDEPNAAIFSKDDLTINGTGKLTVNGNYNNGITSKDDLKILSGNIKIYSTDDGILGRDMVAIKDGTITVEAGGDGIKSTNDADSTKGIIAIEGGTFNLKAKADGIQAEASVFITSGSFNIISGGGSVNGTKKASDSMNSKFGNSTNTPKTETQSAKAIKASTDIGIGGGNFNIDSADDAIHSSNNVTITGGDITIAAGDDGVHADATIVTSGGKINITKSYEGIESTVITISDGEINVTASNDGINASSSSSQNTSSSSANNKLNINGGYIVVNSSGDGLDANGAIYMTKGTVIVSGPTSAGDGALDYDTTFEMSGGLLVTAGSSGMAQATSDTSTQNSIIMNFTKVQPAGTVANLQDSNGNTVATFAPAKNYQSLVISSPNLKKGETYTLYSGGNSTGSGTDGLYTDGKYQDGTKIVTFNISNSVTWLNESGVTTAKSSNLGGGRSGGFKGQNHTSQTTTK